MQRERLQGMQDPKLERRSKMTPTRAEDIGQRARTYIRLVDTAVLHTLIVAGSDRDDTRDIHTRSQEALATVRDEVRRHGFIPELFEEVVDIKIEAMKKAEREEEEDQQLERDLRARVAPVTVFDVQLDDLRTHYRQMSRGFGRKVRS